MHDQDHHLSAAQWSVMESLWESGSLTGREATEAMKKKTGWNRSTTLTLLRRMEENVGCVSLSLKTRKALQSISDAARTLKDHSDPAVADLAERILAAAEELKE